MHDTIAQLLSARIIEKCLSDVFSMCLNPENIHVMDIIRAAIEIVPEYKHASTPLLRKQCVISALHLLANGGASDVFSPETISALQNMIHPSISPLLDSMCCWN